MAGPKKQEFKLVKLVKQTKVPSKSEETLYQGSILNVKDSEALILVNLKKAVYVEGNQKEFFVSLSDFKKSQKKQKNEKIENEVEGNETKV